MFDLGWSELMVIAVIAIIVIGPKDLPKTLRTIGRWVGKARAVAREFQSSMEDLARESDLDELRKDLKSTTEFDIKNEIEKSIDPSGTLDGAFDLPNEIEVPADPAPEPAIAAESAAEPAEATEPAAETAETAAGTPPRRSTGT